MTCTVLTAYKTIKQQNAYGIDCDFNEKYGYDVLLQIRKDIETKLNTINASYINYKKCTTAFEVEYSNLKKHEPYVCTGTDAVLLTPNNFTADYDSNYNMLYSKVIDGSNMYDMLTVQMDIVTNWQNEYVTNNYISAYYVQAQVRKLTESTTRNMYSLNTETLSFLNRTGNDRYFTLSVTLRDDTLNTFFEDGQYEIVYAIDIIDQANHGLFYYTNYFTIINGIGSVGLTEPL